MQDNYMDKFCLPFNGNFNLVKQAVSLYGNKIYEFYGDDETFISSMSVFHNNGTDGHKAETLKQMVQFLHDHGIEFNYTLNSYNSRDYFDNSIKLMGLLTRLKSIGVNTITYIHPVLIDYIKPFGFKSCASLLANIDNETSLSYFIKYGFDRIVLSEDIIKQIPLLKRLKALTPENVTLEIIIDNGCINRCPNKLSHHQNNYNKSITEKSIFFCHEIANTKKDIIKANVIHSKALYRYSDIGFHLFKMCGRLLSDDHLLKNFDHYMTEQQTYSCTRFDVDLPNIDWDKYYNFMFSEPGCTGSCSICNFCDSLISD
jgi:collagenase-like PrtC family protease